MTSIRYLTYQAITAVGRPVMYWMYPLRTLLQPRRFHAYCLGIPRTGTYSVAGMFHRYRAAHEPQGPHVTKIICAAAKGLLNEQKMANFLRKRDKCLWLELESSHFTYFFIDVLLKEFDNAKFILTIRDCYSWLDSYINHQLGRPLKETTAFWSKLRDLYFRPDKFNYAAEEQLLAEHGLYTIDGCLSCWGEYNSKVLSMVPKDRLLIVRTDEIQQDIRRMADFLDIPADSLDRSRSHLNTATKKFGLLSKIDKAFLEEKVDLYCKDLMHKYFPEIQCLDDVIRK